MKNKRVLALLVALSLTVSLPANSLASEAMVVNVSEDSADATETTSDSIDSEDAVEVIPEYVDSESIVEIIPDPADSEDAEKETATDV